MNVCEAWVADGVRADVLAATRHARDMSTGKWQWFTSRKARREFQKLGLHYSRPNSTLYSTCCIARLQKQSSCLSLERA